MLLSGNWVHAVPGSSPLSSAIRQKVAPSAPAAPRVALPIGKLLSVQAERDPHHPALSCDDLTLTRAELAARVNRRARALQLADRGYVMESGEITMSGDAKALLNDPKVRAAYLGE